MELSLANASILIVVALAGREVINQVTAYFFKKVTRDDYVTRKECEAHQLRTRDFVTQQSCDQCSKQDDVALSQLTSDMSTVKGILLVIAVNQGVDPEKLKGLAR